MSTKSWLSWVSTQNWCLQNPGKTAVVLTPQGRYTIKFEPADYKFLLGTDWAFYEADSPQAGEGK